MPEAAQTTTTAHLVFDDAHLGLLHSEARERDAAADRSGGGSVEDLIHLRAQGKRESRGTSVVGCGRGGQSRRRATY